ncbi:MAG TPA: nuclear transport factor 2 family protein, partial [Terriglobales bacterium]
VRETLIATAASEEIVLTVLSHLTNGKIEEALAGFAHEFRFKDHGIGLEFKDKQRLAEFFYKTRELYPDSVLHTDTIFDADNRVITEWTLRFTLTEPFYGGLKRTVKVFVHGASIVRIENGKISDWADYYDGLTSRRTALASFFTEWIEL